MTAPLLVTVIGGYLGAGKTTLVNHMLRHAAGTRIAVLVNEFGTLPIDEDLIEARSDQLLSIAGGCVCCSFGSDLIAALQDIAAMTPRPDHVVIEASGVAIPGAIASSVILLDGFRVDGICVLADGLAACAQIKDEYIGDTITRQMQDADLIIVTKADLMQSQAAADVEATLKAHVEGTSLLYAQHGAVPNSVLLGSFERETAPSAGRHADDDYRSAVLEFAAPVNADQLSEHLSDPSLGVLRAKGFVRCTTGRWALIQRAGSRCEVTYVDDAPRPGLVCIGLKGRLDTDRLHQITKDLARAS